MSKLACPQCNGERFRAVEQYSVLVPVSFDLADDGTIEIDVEPVSEFRKEDATSVTLVYMCATCDFAVAPAALESLRDG